MIAARKQLALLFSTCLLAGCSVQHYASAPISASATAAQLESRMLADPGLRSFEEHNLGRAISQWPPTTWDLQKLSLAALYFNPALDAARARLEAARAAETTARARPNPSLDFVPGIPAPYLLTQDLLFVIETAGKRRDRIQAAQYLDEAAQLDVGDTAWTVLIGVRTALLNDLLAIRNLELLRSEQQLRQDELTILEQIASAGEMTSYDVTLARIDLAHTALATRAAEGQAADAKVALAAAIGVPAAGLGGVTFSLPELDSPPETQVLDVDNVRRDAVINRLDVRRALAQYAAAEANLRTEVAGQYPNFNIGPGYTYEEGHSFFTVGFSTSLPILNRNQGPIGEAEARRREAAAALMQTQMQVIARSERALAVYSSTLKELDQARSLHQLQEAQVQTIQRNVQTGSDTRLHLDGAQIQLSVLARSQLDALGRVQKAFGDLEDAVQRPLAAGDILPIAPGSPALNR